jgi:hypothetical protein
MKAIIKKAKEGKLPGINATLHKDLKLCKNSARQLPKLTDKEM